MSMNQGFSFRNKLRCESPRGFNHKLETWTLSDWFLALTGELGEAANVAKKLKRIADGLPGNASSDSADSLFTELAEELADVYIYLDLTCQRAGVDLQEAVERKFRRTSDKIGYRENAEFSGMGMEPME